ncbi:DUF6318 family protein [Arthrobacter sp. R-11]|uniref:DUF6318 family protein n=1 Tax=Arthrobacter sp. R-11 TaxID=3404053 RepID=UPI003CF37447
MTERSFSFARGRVVAALVGAGLLLSACQDGSPTPGNSPTASSSSASPSASPTPTPSAKYLPASAKGKAQNVPVPAKPALADQNSKAGLEAFTKYWFALLSYGYETGDFKVWKTLTKPSCAFCMALNERVVTSYKGGAWLVGGTIQTPSVAAQWKEGPGQQSVAVQVLQKRTDYYASPGKTSRASTPETNSGAAFFAVFEGGSWTVNEMGRLV